MSVPAFILSGSLKNSSLFPAVKPKFDHHKHLNIKIMTLKNAKRIYWTGAVLTSLWFGASGFFELTRNPVVWDITLKLGYPAYFIYILGVAKLSGIIVLLVPDKLLRLKEWVFAGIFFDIIFAFTSKLNVVGPAGTIDAIIAFIMVTITYLVFRSIYPATYVYPLAGVKK
jgi:hypothetical protein